MNVLIKPVITEHSLQEAQKGRFSFVVARDADRPSIKKAVEKAFDVTVKKIETLSTPAKTYRVGKTRQESRSTRGRKAVVTLEKGQKIGLFEVGSDD